MVRLGTGFVLLPGGGVVPRPGALAHYGPPPVAPLDPVSGAVAMRGHMDAEVVVPTIEGTDQHAERLGHKAVLDQDRNVAWWQPLSEDEE